MLTIQDASVIFYAHYIDTKVGKTGLTVTIDVWEVQRDGTATEVVTGGSATEVGDGLYRYILVAGSVDEPAEYIAVFKTADTDVDQRDIPAIWVIDRPLFADNIVTAVWAAATRTLTSFGTLVTDMWDETLPGTHITTSAGGILGRLVASVWSYITRTLTQSADSLQDVIDGATVSRKRGDYWSVSRTGLGDISGRTSLLVTLKTGYDKTDAQATLQIDETLGLLTVDGEDADDATDAAITINDAVLGNITYIVKADVTSVLTPNAYVADEQMIDANGPQTLEEYSFTITDDVTRAIS